MDHMHNMQSTFSSKSTAVQGLAKGFYQIFILGLSSGNLFGLYKIIIFHCNNC